MISSVDPARIAYMHAYLREPSQPFPDEVEVAFVFGRKSADLVAAAARVASRSQHVVISGNIGKDSGDLPEQRIAEADFVDEGILVLGVRLDQPPHKDYFATNGLENACKGVGIIQQTLGMEAVGTLVTVHHPAQTRRLAGTFALQARRAGLHIARLVPHATGYPLQIDDPFDQYETAFEITRIQELSTLPEDERALDPQPGVEDWLEYAYEVREHLEAYFDGRGILNPSTADDTDHFAPIPQAP